MGLVGSVLNTVSDSVGDILSGVGAVGNVFGGMWAANQSSAEAAKNRDWQEYMSNTAHRRQVADLKAAGLNPLLSASYGGAASGAGSAAQIVNPAGNLGNDINAARKITEVEKEQLALDKELKSSQSASNLSAANLASEQAKTAITQQQLNSAAAARQTAELSSISALAGYYKAGALREMSQAGLNSAQTRLFEIDATRKGVTQPFYDSLGKFTSNTPTVLGKVENWLHEKYPNIPKDKVLPSLFSF